MASLTQIKQRFWNNDGTVAAGGLVYVYLAGTTTLTNSYTDATGLTANTNPVVLDAKGEASIFTDRQVKINVLQSDLVQVTGYPMDYTGQVYANLAGSSTQVFSVAPATAAAHAVRKDQTHITSESPAFSAYQSTLQSIANITLTKIQFQSEEFDTGSCFDSTTNYRFTPTSSGYYQVSATLSYVAAAGTGSLIAIYKNGAILKYGFGGTANGASISALVSMNGTTDYIEIYAYQNSGGAVNTQASADRTFCSGALVRGL